MSVQPAHAASRLSFPALVLPKLPGGRVHQALVDDTGLTFSTIPGWYGNRHSQIVLAIPRSQFVKVESLPPSRWRGARCRVTYRGAPDEQQTLTLKAVDGEVSAHNGFTGLAAQVLHSLHANKHDAEPVIAEYTLRPVRPLIKLVAVPGALAAVMLAASLLRFGLERGTVTTITLVLAFCASAALGATVIDAARLHTAWPWPVKALVAVLAVVAALVLLGTAVTILDVLA